MVKITHGRNRHLQIQGHLEIVGDIVEPACPEWEKELLKEWDELERIGAAIEARNLAEEAARSRKRGKE